MTDQPGVLTAKGQGTTVTFDGSTVSFDRGWNSPGGKGHSAFPLHTLTGVDLIKPGLTAMAGRMTLIVPGGQAQRHTKRDPMSVTFTYKHRHEFEALAEAIRTALTAFHGRAAQAAAATSQGLDGQLANLAALRDSGALTEEEFAAAKARLLGTPGPQDVAPTRW